MGGKSKQETNATSSTQPWQPAIPVLQGILSGVQSQLPNYQPNGLETSAFNQLTQNAQNLPNFAPQAQDLTNKFLTGDPTGLLNPALQNYNNVLNPIATGSLDPTQTPGIQNLLNTIRSDVSNQVNQQFAGAGRDLSGLNTQTLARGIAQGEAAPLLNQYNQNVQNAVGAATGIYNAAGNTANAIGGNQAQAFNFANMIPALANASPLGVLGAQTLQRQTPLQNLGMLANLTVPIAGLGGQSSSHSVTENTASPVQTALGWTGAFSNLLNPFGGQFSPVSNLLGIFGSK